MRFAFLVPRRILLTVLGAAGIARLASAQSQPRRRIAFLGGSRGAGATNWAALRLGLHALGYSENDLDITERYSEGDSARFPVLAAELVRLAPEVIVASPPQAVKVLKETTSTIPIVMTSVGDPVGLGFVRSLAHPGGNITGLSTQSYEMAEKWVELLKTAKPQTKRIAFLLNPANPVYPAVLSDALAAARKLEVELLAIDARTLDELGAAFERAAHAHPDGLIGWGDPVFLKEKKRIVEFAARQKLPAIYQFRDFVTTGSLMSFGPDLKDLYRRAAAYVDKILRGAKPADLPVEQPTKFEFVINLKAAQGLGLTIPPLLFARADEVIE